MTTDTGIAGDEEDGNRSWLSDALERRGETRQALHRRLFGQPEPDVDADQPDRDADPGPDPAA